MIITKHAYEMARERMGLSRNEVREDIRSSLWIGIRKNKIGYYLKGKHMCYAGCKTPEGFIIKTALYHLKRKVSPSGKFI